MTTSTAKATPKVSYESVAQAAEAIKAETGQEPSVRSVRARLGGGSPNTITPLLSQWKAGQTEVRADEVVVDPRIGQIVAEQIREAVAEARRDIEAALSETEKDLAEVAQAGREAEELAEGLGIELETAKAQIQTLTGQIEQLKADAEQIKSEAAAAVAKAEEESAREREATKAAQVALGKAELRLEALPRLEAEIERLRAELDAERTARTDAERLAAAVEAKAGGLTDRLADAQEQHKRELGHIEAQLAEAKERNASTVAKLENRVEDLEKRAAEAEKRAADAEREAREAIRQAAEQGKKEPKSKAGE